VNNTPPLAGFYTDAGEADDFGGRSASLAEALCSALCLHHGALRARFGFSWLAGDLIGLLDWEGVDQYLDVRVA
jgi:hypothetical protein